MTFLLSYFRYITLHCRHPMYTVKLQNKLRTTVIKKLKHRHLHISFSNVLNHKCHIQKYITGQKTSLRQIKRTKSANYVSELFILYWPIGKFMFNSQMSQCIFRLAIHRAYSYIFHPCDLLPHFQSPRLYTEPTGNGGCA